MKSKLLSFLLIIFLVSFVAVSIYDFNMGDFRKNVCENLIGGLIAAIVFAFVLFAVNEFVYRIDISGEWTVMEKFDSVNYAKYQDYQVFYTFHLLQRGNEVLGFGEKVKQIESPNITTNFVPENRTRVEVTGYVRKGYLRDTTLNILIYEKGRIRDSTTLYFLKFTNDKQLEGTFTSTAANAKGPITMYKAVLGE